MILLDTTACIDYLNGSEEIKKVLSTIEELVHITAITAYEINIGLERTKRKVSIKRYNELYRVWKEFISGMEIFSLGFKESEKAGEIYDFLESKGLRIDDNDVLISGIMLSNGIKKILTKNVKHFEKIQGIEILTY